jgi:hypothetical protein
MFTVEQGALQGVLMGALASYRGSYPPGAAGQFRVGLAASPLPQRG